MQELIWLAEPVRIWLDGGDWSEISAAPGFRFLLVVFVVLVPSSLIAVGLGTTEWRDTPLARWFGFREKLPGEDSMWTWRARDIDGDGTPDI